MPVTGAASTWCWRTPPARCSCAGSATAIRSRMRWRRACTWSPRMIRTTRTARAWRVTWRGSRLAAAGARRLGRVAGDPGRPVRCRGRADQRGAARWLRDGLFLAAGGVGGWPHRLALCRRPAARHAVPDAAHCHVIRAVTHAAVGRTVRNGRSCRDGNRSRGNAEAAPEIPGPGRPAGAPALHRHSHLLPRPAHRGPGGCRYRHHRPAVRWRRDQPQRRAARPAGGARAVQPAAALQQRHRRPPVRVGAGVRPGRLLDRAALRAARRAGGDRQPSTVR